MKRIFILSALAIMAFAACKKKVSTVSSVVTVSYPKVTITSQRFFSIPVGGAVPDANAIVATAYDSFYNQQIGVVRDASNVNNLKAGLYTITVSARNQYGYVGYENVYVAVTDVSDTVNISGTYWADNSNLKPAFVTKVTRGLYHTSNLAGADTTGGASLIQGYFVMTSDTAVDLGHQVIPGTATTAANFITGTFGALDLVSVPNTYSYAFTDAMGLFGTGVHVFYKH